MLPAASVVVRTWFGDNSAWESLVVAIQTPSEDGFLANVALVNDPMFEGLSTEALKVKQTAGPTVSFLVDEVTLTNVEQPVLAVRLIPLSDGDERDHRPFRVLPAELWSVENLNLANMDRSDFTDSVSEDEIFRGF